MKRELHYEGRIQKDLKRLDADTQARILSTLERFAATGEGDIRPLRGEFAGSYRLRVGKWRVYMLLEGTQIIAYQIDNRGEAYR
ncbi:MAG TPA: type II toxin-antitoxin system RelE/ParE family toxin [Bryobacteraceae bacterium]